MKHYIIRDIVLSGLDNNTDLLPESKIVKDLFDNIFDGLIEDTYKRGIKWHKNGITYFIQDDKNECMYIDYIYVWSVLESKLGDIYNQIEELTQEMMGHHLKRKVFPTTNATIHHQIRMEHHLKRKVFPTGSYGIQDTHLILIFKIWILDQIIILKKGMILKYLENSILVIMLSYKIYKENYSMILMNLLKHFLLRLKRRI